MGQTRYDKMTNDEQTMPVCSAVMLMVEKMSHVGGRRSALKPLGTGFVFEYMEASSNKPGKTGGATAIADSC